MTNTIDTQALIKIIAKANKITTLQAKKSLNNVVNGLCVAIVESEHVALEPLGAFRKKHMPERIVTDPLLLKETTIKEKNILSFTLHELAQQMVNKRKYIKSKDKPVQTEFNFNQKTDAVKNEDTTPEKTLTKASKTKTKKQPKAVIRKSDKWLTVPAAAKLIGINASFVYKLVAQNKVKSKKFKSRNGIRPSNRVSQASLFKLYPPQAKKNDD